MIRCQKCGTDNLDGSEFCDECGIKLTTVASVRSVPATPAAAIPPPPQFVPPPQFGKDHVAPKPATPYTPPPPSVPPGPQILNAKPPGHQAANAPPHSTTVVAAQTSTLRPPSTTMVDDSNHNLTGGARARLIIQRGGKVGKEFPLANDDSLIGRWDADGGIFPDVDLDQDDPEAKVSRRHARIQCTSNQYLIEDLGSTNGTFVNRGPRLLPGNKQPLKHGDEIIVGKTFLKFVMS